MANRKKQSANASHSSMSAHAKIMHSKRIRDRWITSIVGLLLLGGIAAAIWLFVGRENIEENYSILG